MPSDDHGRASFWACVMRFGSAMTRRGTDITSWAMVSSNSVCTFTPREPHWQPLPVRLFWSVFFFVFFVQLYGFRVKAGWELNRVSESVSVASPFYATCDGLFHGFGLYHILPVQFDGACHLVFHVSPQSISCLTSGQLFLQRLKARFIWCALITKAL